MTTSDRRPRRAIRLTPKDERARYAEEWERNVSDADDASTDSPGILRGALRVALRHRARWAGHALLGGRGSGTRVLLGLGILVVVAFAFLGGSFFGVALLVVLVLVVVALAFAGRPSVLAHWLLVSSAVVGISASAYVWWVLGVQLGAADASTPPAGAASHGGAGLVVLGLSIVLFVVSAIVGYARRPN